LPVGRIEQSKPMGPDLLIGRGDQARGFRLRALKLLNWSLDSASSIPFFAVKRHRLWDLLQACSLFGLHADFQGVPSRQDAFNLTAG
jgi:hypothetical protein